VCGVELELFRRVHGSGEWVLEAGAQHRQLVGGDTGPLSLPGQVRPVPEGRGRQCDAHGPIAGGVPEVYVS
jgi:hypothetical protein